MSACYSCGAKIKNIPEEPKFCDACRKKIEEGYDLW